MRTPVTVTLFGQVLAVVMMVAVALLSAEPAPNGSCMVIQELTATKPLLEHGHGCSTRLSPASTFKIPHALVALETGVVTAESVERWDGTRHERQAEWNHDHTVISALRPSVLWFFQRIAPRVGAERMTRWLDRFHYGNRDVSGPVTEYWINGRLASRHSSKWRFSAVSIERTCLSRPPTCARCVTAWNNNPGPSRTRSVYIE